jgi:hypothetical protein
MEEKTSRKSCRGSSPITSRVILTCYFGIRGEKIVLLNKPGA